MWVWCFTALYLYVYKHVEQSTHLKAVRGSSKRYLLLHTSFGGVLPTDLRALQSALGAVSTERCTHSMYAQLVREAAIHTALTVVSTIAYAQHTALHTAYSRSLGHQSMVINDFRSFLP